MAHITLAGTLRDPDGNFAVGDKIRFTHNSTTGETVKSAMAVLTIDPSGVYSIDLEYGLVLVEYKDSRDASFKNLGVATVNATNTATSIPELLNAVVPVSSAELIEFQTILADCVAVSETLSTGVAAFSTLALLTAYTPTAAQQYTSFKVTSDTTSSNNGYYSWSGSAYIKDADLVVNTINAANTSDAVSGAAVYLYDGESTARQNMELGVDVKSTATWIDGILRTDGSITNLGGGYSFYTEEFYQVIPNETVLDVVCYSSFVTDPIILGYSKDKLTVTVILASVNNDTRQVNFYGKAPDNVYFVRFATKDHTGSDSIRVSGSDEATLKLFEDNPRKINRDDYFVDGLGKESFLVNGTAAISNALGSGFVPVIAGDNITYKGYSVSSVGSIGGFDSNKVFVRTILEHSDENTTYNIQLDPVIDVNIAFIVCSHYKIGDPTEGFLIVESSQTIENITYEIQNTKDKSKSVGYSNDVVVTAFNANSTVTEVGGFDILDAVGTTAYFNLSNDYAPSSYFSSYWYQVELELLAFSGVLTEATLKVFTSLLSDDTDFTFTSIGEKHTFTVFKGLRQTTATDLRVDNEAGVQYKVTRKAACMLQDSFFDKYTLKEFFDIQNNLNLLDDKVSLSDWSELALESSYNKFDTLNKGKIVSFGDSITSGGSTSEVSYMDYVHDYFRMELTNLAIWGSSPSVNLNDANLANIPNGATVITITGGTNQTFVDSGDVTSRDRATGQGIINYAIDYIEINHPTAIVILQTVPYRYAGATNPSDGWSQAYRDVAEYRNLLVSEVEKHINWNTNNIGAFLYDFTHPSIEGARRIASILIKTIKSVAY